MPVIKYKSEVGERLPSMSGILNQWGIKTGALVHWAYKQGQKGVDLYAQTEAQVGTCVHEMIECDIKGKAFDHTSYSPEFLEKSELPFQNYLKWKKEISFEPVETEISLISEQHQFGGTLDCVAIINGQLSIVDWKTGKDVYEDHIIQVEGYRHLWNENFPDHQITGGFHILRTGKEIAMFSHNWYGEFPAAWEVFLHLRKLYDLAKIIKKLK